jgi:hypothetical protein
LFALRLLRRGAQCARGAAHTARRCSVAHTKEGRSSTKSLTDREEKPNPKKAKVSGIVGRSALQCLLIVMYTQRGSCCVRRHVYCGLSVLPVRYAVRTQRVSYREARAILAPYPMDGTCIPRNALLWLPVRNVVNRTPIRYSCRR